MKIGYIRVSRDRHITALQEEALRHEQCERVCTDQVAQNQFDRPEFLRMLDVDQAGDIIVVWRLDRLGKSLKHLIETLTMLGERELEVRSLKENIDTTTSTGKLLFHLIRVMAESERDIIRERTLAGLEAARARGKKGGRPKAITNIDPQNLMRAKHLYAAKQNTIQEIMSITGFKSRSTFYKYVVNDGEEEVSV